MLTTPGIYVEVRILASIDEVWRLTQDPGLHQRWDLRFSRIEYLPREGRLQRFLYETRIGFGLRIRGTGESVGQLASPTGDVTSSLRFSSEDPKSLIKSGSGYWRYIPTESGVRFLTWYDYTARFGVFGRMLDRVLFRPLIGWSTAWSFDCMRLWAEGAQTPEASTALSFIHAVARVALAFIWIWHGLIPKLVFRHVDEQMMLRQAHVPVSLLPWLGLLEMLFGLIMLFTWRRRSLFLVNIALMMLASVSVTIYSTTYLRAAFNPITLNVSVTALALVGWLASRILPDSRRCLRNAPEAL